MDAKIDRRALIGVGLASTVGACAPCPKFVPVAGDGRPRVGDAHVHLFNAADLPVKGFMRDVLVPAYLGNASDVVLAIIDIALSVLKGLSISAEAEMSQRIPPWRHPQEEPVSPLRFANVTADRMELQMRAQPKARGAVADPQNNLADSYRALAGVIDAASIETGPRPQQEQDPNSVDRLALSRVAELGTEALPESEAKAAVSGLDAKQVFAILRWSFLMVQSRCSHLHKYLTFAEHDSGLRVELLINLLVDYDAWLDDAPKAGSSHPSQVAFWTGYSRAVKGRVDIRTFAGFDPLKHAEQRVTGGSGYFEAMKAWYEASDDASHKIHGFKLYPPMGFRVIGNTGRVPHTGRAADFVARKWKAWPTKNVDVELDASLDTFFAYCAEKDVPITTHARHSQNASDGAEGDASLEYWYKRALAQPKPLRACMGHFDWRPIAYRQYMPKIMRLNREGKANIYFDIGYSEEFINGTGGTWILDLIASLCQGLAPEKNVMFGTDWIMLGQEPRVNEYYKAVLTAVRAHDYWKHHEKALFGGNLRDFLKLPQQVADWGGMSSARACYPVS